jgi:hypothetical protein
MRYDLQYPWFIVIIIAIVCATAILTSKPAACQNACPLVTCINSNQCGMRCSCYVPNRQRLGTCVPGSTR